MVEIIQSDFLITKGSDDFRISSSFDGTEIHENSLEDFLKHKKIPKVFSNLYINQYGKTNNGDEGISHLQLKFYNSFVSLYVSGSSESLVIGKFSQVTDFLRKRRPFFWFFHTKMSYFIRGVLAGSVLFFPILLHRGLDILGILLLLGIALFFFSVHAMTKFSHTKINLQDKISFMEKYKTVIIIIGIVASIFTIIGVILEFIMWQSSQ
ncbi:MAG: hypothetical protein RIG61_11510 [Deltaproteobacteria bacterium]